MFNREGLLATLGVCLGGTVGVLVVVDLLRSAVLIVLAVLGLLFVVRLMKLDFAAMMTLVLILTLLAPPYRLSEFPDVRAEQLVVFAFPVLVFMYTVASGKRLSKPSLTVVDVIFLAYAVCILASIILGYLFLHVPLSYHDFMEFVKIGLYYVAFRLGMRVQWRETALRNYAIPLLIAVFALALIAISQGYNLFGVNEYLSPMYIQREWLLTIVRRASSFRVSGTTGNPNHFGFMEVMIVTFLLSTVLFCQQRLHKVTLVVLLVALGLSLYSILLTASRTATVALAVSAVFILATFVTNNLAGRVRTRILTVALVLVLGLAVIPFAHGRFFTAVGLLLDPSGISQHSTIQGRLVMWTTALEQIRWSPVFGWGVATVSMSSIVDNDYLLLMRRFGIVGLAILLLLFLTVFLKARDIARGMSSAFHHAYGRAVQGVIIGLALFSVAAGAFGNQQLMVIFWVLAGGLYGLASRASGQGV